jgi:hypothetical protein
MHCFNVFPLFLADELPQCILISFQVFDECKIYDPQLISFVEIHSDHPQKFPLHMELILTKDAG